MHDDHREQMQHLLASAVRRYTENGANETSAGDTTKRDASTPTPATTRVKTAPLPSRTPPSRIPRSLRLATAVLALLFGIPFWLVGARYTVDGWIVGINWFVGWLLDLPPVIIRAQLPKTGYLVAMLVLGLCYSRVERYWPIQRHAGRVVVASIIIWVLWLLVSGTDIGSTYLGVAFPEPDAWPIARWVADRPPIAGIWSLILTYGPEFLILYGIQQLRG